MLKAALDHTYPELNRSADVVLHELTWWTHTLKVGRATVTVA